MLQGLSGNAIVLVVAGVVPVIDEGIEHSTAFPPIIRVRQVSRSVTFAVTGVVLAQVYRESLCDLLNVVCMG